MTQTIEHPKEVQHFTEEVLEASMNNEFFSDWLEENKNVEIVFTITHDTFKVQMKE